MNEQTLAKPASQDVESAYVYNCGHHCKLCPFPGFKCNGRPSKLNYEDKSSPFAKLIAAKNLAEGNCEKKRIS